MRESAKINGGTGLSLMYEVLISHRNNPKHLFSVYDWIEDEDESEETLLRLISEHLRARALADYVIVKIRVAKKPSS